MNWSADEMKHWWNKQLKKKQIDEVISYEIKNWCKNRAMKLKVDEIDGLWNEQLTKRHPSIFHQKTRKKKKWS